jgi:hypothetical protein
MQASVMSEDLMYAIFVNHQFTARSAVRWSSKNFTCASEAQLDADSLNEGSYGRIHFVGRVLDAALVKTYHQELPRFPKSEVLSNG